VIRDRIDPALIARMEAMVRDKACDDAERIKQKN
jgi:hypothetical protein